MRSVVNTFICISACFLSQQAHAAPPVDVKLNYKYSGEPKVPPKNATYCLEIAQSKDLSANAVEKLHKACALAAGLKGYHLVGKEAGCRKITAELSVEDDENGYVKTAEFFFFEDGPQKPSLKVKANFDSETGEFNSYSMIASCRAVFNEIPAESKVFHVDASTEPDDTGRHPDDRTDHPPVNGRGVYVMSELMLNGLGGSAGYYFSEELAVEAGFLDLGRSLNMDANRLMKYYVKSRLFFTRRAYVGVGLGWQNSEFGEGYQYFSSKHSIKRDTYWQDTSGEQFQGSLQTFGGEVSLGYLFVGASLKKGLVLGADWFGVFAPWMITENKIKVASGDSKMRERIAQKIQNEKTYYLLRFLVGYNF